MKKVTEFEKAFVAVGKREEAVMEGILEFNKKCAEKHLSIHAFPIRDTWSLSGSPRFLPEALQVMGGLYIRTLAWAKALEQIFTYELRSVEIGGEVDGARELEEFAKRINRPLSIRLDDGIVRVRFEGGIVREKDGSLYSFHDFIGEGHNIKEAMNKYWNYIQGKSIVFKGIRDCQVLEIPKDTEIKVEGK